MNVGSRSKHEPRSYHSRTRARRGFSLAECAISLLMTAVLIVGGLKAVSSTQRTRTEAQNQQRATELALRLMGEIRQAAYIDPNQTPVFGLESGEFNFSNRVNYDDVDDFISITEFALKDKDGTTVPGSSGYTRSRDVEWVDPNNPTVTVGTDQGLKRITVTVNGPGGRSATVVGLRSSKGLGEQQPQVATTYVTWAGASVTVGSGTPLSTGVDLINGDSITKPKRMLTRRHNTPVPRPARRGTSYLLVVGAATIVSLVGMTGLMVTRLQFRQAAQAREWSEAGDLALSAIELGIAKINATSTWRTTFTNNAEFTPIAMGNGSLSYKFVDAALGLAGGDGNLNNNTYDPVRLHGIGRVRNTVRVYSVQLVGDVPLDVLRTTVATSGYLNNAITSTAAGGPLSSNGLFTRGATVNGNVEAGSVTGSGTINGTLTTPAAAKTMPDVTVFDAYRRMATTVAWPGGSTWTMTGALLSNATNPFGVTNPNGIYYVNVPASSTLRIQISHVKGTFVVDCQGGAKVEVTQPIFWEPNTSDLPILLIRHLTTSTARDLLRPVPGTIVEGATTYSSKLKGLVHVIGATGAASGNLEASIGNGGTFQGSLIINQDARIELVGATFNFDPYLKQSPPVGYTTGPTVKVAIGSLQWEAAP